MAIDKNTKAIAAKMTSWNLKAGGVDGEAEIKDGNEVTFDVATKDQGLTVTRDGSTIKYGIEGSKIDISENKTVKELREEAKKHTSVKAGDYVTVDEGTNEAGGKEYTVKGPDITVSDNLGIKDKTNSEGKKVGYEISLNKNISVDNVTVKEKLTAKTVDTETVNAGTVNTKTVKASDKITVGEGDTVTIDKDGLTIKDGPSVTAAGIDAGKKKITNVAAGDVSENSTDVVNGGQLFTVKDTAEKAAEEAKKHTSVVAGDYTTVTESTNEAGGKKYTVTGPSVKTDNNLTIQDIMTGDKKTGYTIGLAKDLKDLNSVSAKTVNADTVDVKTVKAGDKVTVGDKVTLGTTGLTIKDGPSVTAAGIDAGKKKITNVAAGDVSEKSTEAVNGGQLFGVEQKVNINSRNISILGGKVSELNTRVNRVGAGAAALAALHPLDFDPDDKWDFAAGYGNYKGANAAAIGAYYRPNEDTMVSVGGSFGGGENMVNAGVSVKLGQGNHVTTSRVAMAKEIKDLRAEVEVLRQAVTGIGQGQTPDPVKMKLFPDIAKNHWAYEAVEELTKQGLLEGYPDGTFGGDRMMTRYEFAEIVYRAMQKGLNVNEKLIQEFEPELERFRIDVISKDKNGNPVIERVRVNEKKKAK